AGRDAGRGRRAAGAGAQGLPPGGRADRLPVVLLERDGRARALVEVRHRPGLCAPGPRHGRAAGREVTAPRGRRSRGCPAPAALVIPAPAALVIPAPAALVIPAPAALMKSWHERDRSTVGKRGLESVGDDP